MLPLNDMSVAEILVVKSFAVMLPVFAKPDVWSDADATTVTLLLDFWNDGVIDTIMTVGAVLSRINVPSVCVTEFPTVSVAVSTTLYVPSGAELCDGKVNIPCQTPFCA